ncbi:MAG: hypothetical protein L0Y61_08215 [Epsilonproteobacteria bacterium]|nr:hypothetical protein [Campylobacterota bacterium]
MKKLVLTMGIVGLVVQTLQAKDLRTAPVLFEKKCQMCHASTLPKTPQEQNKMVSPPMAVVMKNTVMGIDAELDVGTPDAELRKVTISFMKDYLYNPDRKKSNCEDISFDRFGMMPSLKGFITEEELDVVLPWVYDSFKPTKVNGKWIGKK